MNLFREDSYPKDPKNHEEDYFEKMPISIIGNLEQYQLSGAEGVHCLIISLSDMKQR